VTAAYDQLLALAAAELAAAEHAADSECVRPPLQGFRHVLTGACCRYWQRKRAAARTQLQLLRHEHEARMREQEEKEDAERLLNQVSKGVRDGANAKQRAEMKRALSARARELEAAQKQAERFVTAAFQHLNSHYICSFSCPLQRTGTAGGRSCRCSRHCRCSRSRACAVSRCRIPAEARACCCSCTGRGGRAAAARSCAASLGWQRRSDSRGRPAACSAGFCCVLMEGWETAE
jgi:hypothetical protein